MIPIPPKKTGIETFSDRTYLAIAITIVVHCKQWEKDLRIFQSSQLTTAGMAFAEKYARIKREREREREREYMFRGTME